MTEEDETGSVSSNSRSTSQFERPVCELKWRCTIVPNIDSVEFQAAKKIQSQDIRRKEESKSLNFDNDIDPFNQTRGWA